MHSFKFSSLFLLIAVSSVGYAAKTCNVLDYGGVADNATDIGLAIIKAHADCVSGATTTDPADTVLLVPPGTYALQTFVYFEHPSYFTIEINGELNLVFDPALKGNMFLFDRCDHLVWKGNGTIHGHGDLWRPNNNLGAYPNRPRLLRFQNCNNTDISGVTLHNSPMFHVVIIGNDNVAHDMKIIADHIGATDGFDVLGNNNYVHDVSVENGDECVTLKSPTNGFVAENIQCHYSAGCNIGSFGKDATGVSVQNVYYRNVTLNDGDAGIMLKSFSSSQGVVKNLTYVDFTFTNVAHPIKITDHWCPQSNCPETTGSLSWQDITFQSITGTGDRYRNRPTIEVNCTSGPTCTGITFEDVQLAKEGDATPMVHLENACGSGLPNLPAC
ncbi:glycoside hydrolase family 28 protein [Boletus edulis]|nr:glycoside hydrolase family 28 protein [Boletus edulis]